jgi:hypothetical protein
VEEGDEERVAMMSGNGSYRDSLDGNEPTKPCTFGGCAGTMRFNPRLKEAGAPHTLEWPWHPTWVCGDNAAHFEIGTAEDEREAARRR